MGMKGQNSVKNLKNKGVNDEIEMIYNNWERLQ